MAIQYGQGLDAPTSIIISVSQRGKSKKGSMIIQTLYQQKQAWMHYCNSYALLGYMAKGTRLRMADDYTCIAVANIYQCNLHVHTKFGTKKFQPFEGVAYCTIHLALCLAPEWKHYRSTRKIISPPPASPDPANSDLEPAEDGPMSRVSSGSANAEPQLNLHASPWKMDP